MSFISSALRGTFPFVLASAAVCVLPAGAQTRTMTLQQCIDYANEHNISLQQKRLAVEQSEVDVYASQGQLFPSLSFATSQGVSWRPWSNNYVNVSDGTMTVSQSEVNYNGSYGLTARWDLWNGGRNYKQVKRDKAAVEQSRLEADGAALSVSEQVIQDYVQILYQAEAVEVNRQILESTRVQAARAKEMVEVGSMSRADLAQINAQVSQEEYNLANSRTQLASFKLALKTLLQLPGDEPLEVTAPAPLDTALITSMLPALEDVYAAALATRPEIAAQQVNLRLAEMDIDLAKRQRYPTVGMNAGINTSNTSGMDTGFFTQLKTNLSNSIGVSLSVPIFDNRSASAAIKRAKLSKLNSQLSLQDAQTTLYSTVETLHLNAANAAEQYRYASVNAQAMQVSYDLVSEQFAVGLKDIVDLTTGKNNLINARQQLLQAKYTALLNRSLLRFYQGQPLTL